MSILPYLLAASAAGLTLYFILRTPKFWREVEDLLQYPSSFETMRTPCSPGTTSLFHLRSARETVGYFRIEGPEVIRELLSVTSSTGLNLDITYEGDRVTA